jgi:hypothetical protein
MTYKIRFRNTGSLHESEPKTFEEANSIAVSLSNWNHRVEIVDADLPSVVIKRFEPYSKQGALEREEVFER